MTAVYELEAPAIAAAAAAEAAIATDAAAIAADANVPKEMAASSDGVSVDSPEANDNDDAAQVETEEEGVEKWDLVAILGASQIRKAEHPCAENCGRTACSVWAKKGADDEDPWYACVECQFSFFEGFPKASTGDLPIDSITAAHRALIAERCSDGCTADMILPDLPTKAVPPAAAAAAASSTSATVVAAAAAAAGGGGGGGVGGGAVTPPPGKGLVVAAGAKSKKNGKSDKSSSPSKTTSGVTPSPVPPRGASAGAAAAAASSAAGGNTTAVSKKVAAKAAKAKKNTLEPMLKKWQDAATSMGGGKIVVAKAEAKKIVFDMLSDAFRPMNITEIFNVRIAMYLFIALFLMHCCGHNDKMSVCMFRLMPSLL
jgi:hypothetical protein